MPGGAVIFGEFRVYLISCRIRMIFIRGCFFVFDFENLEMKNCYTLLYHIISRIIMALLVGIEAQPSSACPRARYDVSTLVQSK